MNIKALVVVAGGIATIGGGTAALMSAGSKTLTYQEAMSSGVDIVLEQNGQVIAEYPSLEDAEIISGYPTDLILESINDGTTIDGFTFERK